MLTYALQPDGREPLYEQLCRHIREDIRAGRLRAGEHLPSKRTLAENLGVSSITVENAYEQLISEGYVASRPRRGYYVAALGELLPPSPVSPVPRVPGGPQRPAWWLDLSGNQTSPERFPFSVWARLMRETISGDSAALLTPAPCSGVLALREAIAGHLRSFRGMSVHPDQIVVGAGTEYLYGLLIQLLGRGRVYCVENPGYPKLARIYRSHGVVCRCAALDGQGMTVQGLRESEADVAHISPAHHFPTGVIMPVSRRYELLSWAGEREGRVIIEDDYDSEFRLNGRPLPTLQSIDAGGRVIYMNTFSKSLAPTIRISYMVLPPRLAERYLARLSFYACTVSNFEQYTLARFIREGYFEKHINRMRLFYARRRQQVLDALAESPLAPRSRVEEAASGLHFLLCLDTALPDTALQERLRAQGIHLASLSDYDLGGGGTPPHRFLINYSNLPPERLPEALRRVAACLEEAPAP